VVLLASALVLSLVLFTGREDKPPPLRSGVLEAEALVNSIGVCVHFNYVDTAYGRQAEVLERLRELGVRHLREVMPIPPVGPLAEGLRAAGRLGMRATLTTGDPEVHPARAVADSIRAMGGSIDAFEGPNELDSGGDPAWPATLRAYMPALAAAAAEQAPGVPVIGPSFINPDNRRFLPPDLPGRLNAHVYPGGGPPEPVVAEALRGLEAEPGRRPVLFTETGYHNALGDSSQQPPASEEAAGIYLPRLLVTAFGAGVRRTFVYELLDEKPEPAQEDLQQHFGLLRNDLSPKPAFTAISTLIAALRASPDEESSPERLRWRLRGAGDEAVERLTLVRRDGSYVIALWRPVSVWDEHELRPIEPEPLEVELRFGRQARDVTVWRPSMSTAPVLRRGDTERLPLELAGDLVLVSLR
jgi:hypothetical protein